mmetsp:Transcript_18661/g.29228  ORF Transcript_18661/g.29228 Transcript_18661/m.29228 type:complete len:251 (+) Transcript_18661:180-932(+)
MAELRIVHDEFFFKVVQHVGTRCYIHHWGTQSSVGGSIPGDGVKQGMALNRLPAFPRLLRAQSVGEAAKSLGGFLHEQASNHIPGGTRDMLWYIVLATQYQLPGLLAVERALAAEQLVHKRAKLPVVHGVAVRRGASQHLWGRIHHRPAHGLSAVAPQHLGQAKVSKFHMALRIYKQIFRFEVPVHDSTAVNMLQGQQYFRCIKEDISGSDAVLSKQGIQVAPSCKIHDKVSVLALLDRRVKLYHKRVFP